MFKFFLNSAYQVDLLSCLRLSAVGTIDTHHIHPGLHQGTNLVLGIRGGAEGTDNFGTTHSTRLSPLTGKTERN